MKIFFYPTPPPSYPNSFKIVTFEGVIRHFSNILLSSFELVFLFLILLLKIFGYNVNASWGAIPHPPLNIRTHIKTDYTCLHIDLFYELQVLNMLT